MIEDSVMNKELVQAYEMSFRLILQSKDIDIIKTISSVALGLREQMEADYG